MNHQKCRRPFAAVVSAAFAVAGLAATPLAAQQPDWAPLHAEGTTVFADVCSACHGARGQGTGSGPALDGSSVVSDRSGLINQIMWGAPEHGMPPFAPMLSDREIAAVATFVRNAWSNSHGPVLEQSVTMRR